MTKMNKLLSGMLVAFAASAFSVPAAQAYTMDTLLGSAMLVTNAPTPTCAGTATTQDAMTDACMSYFAGQTVTFDYKVDLSGSYTKLLDGSGNYYIDVSPNEPGYFALKFGVGNTGADSTWFFQNIAELTKLVWREGDCVGCVSGEVKGLSHYSLYDPGNHVPEPGTIALLGLGLFGMAAMRRRATQ